MIRPMKRRLLNLLTALSLLLSCGSCAPLLRVEGPVFLREPELLWRLHREAQAHSRATGKLPPRAANLSPDAVERLRPLPPGFDLRSVRFYAARDGEIVMEWRPEGKRTEWMWVEIDGDQMFTQGGPYPRTDTR